MIRCNIIISISSIQSFNLKIFLYIIINSRPLFLGQFTHLSIESHTITEIILHILVLGECFQYVTNNIFHRLEVHLQHIDVFLMLFYLFFIQVALVHKLILILFFDLLLLQRQLVYLALLYMYRILLLRALVHQAVNECLLLFHDFLQRLSVI